MKDGMVKSWMYQKYLAVLPDLLRQKLDKKAENAFC